MRESESVRKRNEAQEKGEMLMCVYIYCVLSVSGWILGERRRGRRSACHTPPQPALPITYTRFENKKGGGATQRRRRRRRRELDEKMQEEDHERESEREQAQPRREEERGEGEESKKSHDSLSMIFGRERSGGLCLSLFLFFASIIAQLCLCSCLLSPPLYVRFFSPRGYNGCMRASFSPRY